MFRAYQIYYNKKSFERIHPECIGYDNGYKIEKKQDPFFENTVICELIDSNKHLDTNYFGVFSWQFESKNKYRLIDLKNDLKDESVYTFYNAHRQPNVWRVAEMWHKGIINIAEKIFNKFDKSIHIKNLHTPTVYQNAHLSKPEIYEDYVINWLKPLINIMISEDEIKKLLETDTRYKSGEFKKADMRKITGFEFYPMHPFVCERFFSTYLAVKKIKVTHLA